MTASCFDNLNAKREYIIESDDDEVQLDLVFDLVMKGGGVCGKCFTEYVDKL